MVKKRNFRVKTWIVLCGMFSILLLTLLTSSFYSEVLQKEGRLNRDIEEKAAHYVMILENTDSTFWKSVYKSAKEEAKRNNVILELSESRNVVSYDIRERMKMSVAAEVDGIILEYNGEEKLDEEIREAAEQGIPVVTVLNDGATKGSISFAGVNNYQLAQKYGEEILKILKPDMKKIMVLTHGDTTEEGEEQIYNQINNMIVNSEIAPDNLSMETRRICSSKAFDAEEGIWNVFQDRDSVPDVLICFNEIDTECAYQALINYNLVGRVQIVGYYYTDTILNAVAEGIIPVTLSLDTKQIGHDSVRALIEYEKDGYTNSFYSADLNTIDQETAKEMLKDEQGEIE